MEVGDKSVLVVDTGWFCEIAARLTREFQDVWYWSPWQGEFPYSQDYAVGSGMPGVWRTKDLWDVVDDVDLIVFPADGFEDAQRHLRGLGKRVWGSGDGCEMEANRVMLKNWLHDSKQPILPFELVRGIEGLEALLRSEEDIWIKLVRGARGDMETWHHHNWALSQMWFYNLRRNLGPLGSAQMFMWERPAEGFEGGMDWIQIGAHHPNRATIGYEIKDSCYVSTVKDWGRISRRLTDSAECFAQYFGAVEYANLVSTEVRIVDDESYMIDLAARFPWPPAGSEMENIVNLGEVMYYGAEGILIQPRYQYKFGVELNVDSPALTEGWLAVEIPMSERRWFKFHSAAEHDGVIWLRKQDGNGDTGYIGTVVALGNDFKATKELAIERAGMLKGQKVQYELGDLEKAEKEIAEGEKAGINFWD